MITEPERRAGNASGAVTAERWLLRLYVAGQTPRSSAAFDNLNGRYTIEVIDRLKSPRLAKDDRIFAVPTVVRKVPCQSVASSVIYPIESKYLSGLTYDRRMYEG